MTTNFESKSKMFPPMLASTGNLAALAIFFTVMLLEIGVAVDPSFSASLTTTMLLIGAVLLGLILRDPLLAQTKDWSIAVYLLGWILVLNSIAAIFVSNFVPLALWVNSLASIIAFLVASNRIIEREFTK